MNISMCRAVSQTVQVIIARKAVKRKRRRSNNACARWHNFRDKERHNETNLRVVETRRGEKFSRYFSRWRLQLPLAPRIFDPRPPD